MGVDSRDELVREKSSLEAMEDVYSLPHSLQRFFELYCFVLLAMGYVGRAEISGDPLTLTARLQTQLTNLLQEHESLLRRANQPEVLTQLVLMDNISFSMSSGSRNVRGGTCKNVSSTFSPREAGQTVPAVAAEKRCNKPQLIFPFTSTLPNVHSQERLELAVMLQDNSSLAEEVRQEMLQCDQELKVLEVHFHLFFEYIHPIVGVYRMLW